MFRKIVGFKAMCTFVIVAGITVITNYDAGIMSNINKSSDDEYLNDGAVNVNVETEKAISEINSI